MIDPLFALTLQAVLIWAVVFSASAPIPRLPRPWAIFAIIVTTVAALVEVIQFNGAGLLITGALGGYAWGSLFHDYIANKLAARERRVLDGD